MVYMSNFNKMSRHVGRVHWLWQVFTSYLVLYHIVLHLLCTVCEPTKSKKTISKSEQGWHFVTNFVEDFSIFAKGFDQSLSDFFFFFLNEKIFVDVNITPKVKAKSCDSVENTFPRYWQKEERTADMLRKKNFVVHKNEDFLFLLLLFILQQNLLTWPIVYRPQWLDKWITTYSLS